MSLKQIETTLCLIKPVLLLAVDDVFFSMADMDMSHSLSSLPPLGEPPTVDLDLSLNSNYSASPGESPSGNAAVSPTHQSNFDLLV